MPIFIRELSLGLDEPEDLLPQKAARRLRIDPKQILQWAIVRRSLDARRHDRLRFNYNLELALDTSPQNEARIVRKVKRQDVQLIKPEPPPLFQIGNEALPERPVIVGFGPAGMFAGFLLAEAGYRPLIIERGRDVSTRHRDIMVDFYRRGIFHAESNLLFGEGGAGTYSDGKLYTRVKDPRVQRILQIFYQHGANPDILIEGKPHIGSDKLPGICRRLRKRIEARGGEVRFASRLDNLYVENGMLTGLVVNNEKMSCGPVLLGIGLSARDTFRMLQRSGIMLQAKPWQLGVRIEHPQAMVDRWQYGSNAGHCRLTPAEYHLVAKKAAGQRGDLFSFCMCPGGTILPTNESPGEIAVNGASRSKRKNEFANSGLIITMQPEDLGPEAQNDPLLILDFLESLEKRAFELTGGTYQVPAQRASDFLAGRHSDGQLQTSYPLGGQWRQLQELLPPVVNQALENGLAQLDRRLDGFAGPDALLTAPESRASSPIRIARHRDSHESVSAQNLYPIGEGAGFAGGIISAALDGFKTAEKIMARYSPY
jgi:hypothetical protein